MIRRFLPALILAMAVALGACHRSAVDDTLDTADRLMETRPDSALTLLSTIDSEHLGSDALRGRYALLYSMALYKNYIPAPDDSLVRVAYDYYCTRGEGCDATRAAYYRAAVANEQGDNMGGMKAGLEALRLATEASDTLFEARACELLGDIAQSSLLFDESIKYNSRAAKAFRSMGRHTSELWALYDIARSKDDIMLHDEADMLLDSLLAMARYQLGDSTLVATVISGKMCVALNAGKINEGLSQFEQRSMMVESLPLNVNDYISGATLNLIAGKLSESKDLLDAALALPLTDLQLLDIRNIQAYYYKHSGALSDAFATLDTVLAMQNAQVNKVMNQSAARSMRDYYQELSLESEARERSSRHILWAWIIGSLIAVVAIIIGSRHAITLRNRRIERQMLEISYLTKAINKDLTRNSNGTDASVREPDNLKRDVAEQFEVLDRLCDRYLEVENTDVGRKYVYDRVTAEVSKLREKETLAKIVAAVDESMEGIVTRLGDAMPSLSKNDVIFAALVYAGFSARTISFIFEIKLSTFYSRRRRLAAKITASLGDNATHFLYRMSK